ncbi:MAG: hypothetical protein ABSF16_13385 [Terracidiphilus sp.]|jgi:hypothetical protein
MARLFDELGERLLRAGVAPRHVRRYLRELGDHLADLRAEEEHAGKSRADAESAALARLGEMEDLARAMMEQSHLQSWSARAPWAMCGLAPLFVLAAAWFVALFILWSGWQIFKPEATSPFGGGPHYGFANIYFQAGKAIYFGAPYFVGWGIGWMAARQRLKVLWPILGLALVALAAGTAQVHASRTGAYGGAYPVSMSFALGSSIPAFLANIQDVAVILTFTALPYLIWRLRQARSLSS